MEDTKKIDIAKNAFKVALLRRAAINENMHNDEELKKEVEKRKQMLFAKEYMDYIADRDVTVTPKEYVMNMKNTKIHALQPKQIRKEN
jgi:hypothetical protein